MNPITKLCIIRASREEYQKVWSAITMVRSIGNCPVLFNLLDLSGSIKACRNVALYVKTETSSEHDAKVEDKLQDGTSRDEEDSSNNNIEVESNLEGDLEED
nr:putative ribonuclease p/mrp protein subunit pop5 [Quercus suber]